MPLTASDRPYKKAKSLSESVKILSFFKKDRHIDADLFDDDGLVVLAADRRLGFSRHYSLSFCPESTIVPLPGYG